MNQTKPITCGKVQTLFRFMKFQLFMFFLKLGQPYCDMEMYT